MESVLQGNCFRENKWVREYIGIIQFCMHGFELILCCIPQRRTCLFNRAHPVALLNQYVKLMPTITVFIIATRLTLSVPN
jgi:hypothetical protein